MEKFYNKMSTRKTSFFGRMCEISWGALNGLGATGGLATSLPVEQNKKRKFGAQGGTRTRTLLRATDFKSAASTIPPPGPGRNYTG